MTTQEHLAVNRQQKDTMFRMIFQDKAELLKLYNAMSGKNYSDPDLLEINTLQNAIYMSMKNDLSFLIDAQLFLYEHQSSDNPNLPLRFLFYLSDLYSNITKDKNLYGTNLISIPAPRFVIFYNGTEMQPEQQLLKLSDMYSVKESQPSLELTALMLNINRGYNQDLMDACKTLYYYAEYTYLVRTNLKTLPLKEAVKKAIRHCIQHDILKDFLEQNLAEVIKVSIYEYDEKKHIRLEREEAKAQGIIEGEKSHLAKLIQKKLSKGLSISEISDMLEEPEVVIESIIMEYKLHA